MENETVVMNMTDKIDFVVLWVDGSDPDWLRQRQHYSGAADNGSTANRFRDWGLMRYWFRAAEQYAPWVNRIWFVTNGQVPAWLNREHPRLRLISHKEYIPETFLPTFNSNVIELWLHEIPDLAEQFVLFNDDMFLTAPVTPEDFFRSGLPRDSALLDQVTTLSPEDCFPHMMVNNFSIINKYFRKSEVLKQNRAKFFTLQYGKDLLRNLLLTPFQNFSAFRDLHLPSSHLKSTFREVWDAEPELLTQCSANRFRSKTDLTHWLMKCWNICRGRFDPRPTSWGRHFELWEDDIDSICADLMKQKYRTVCLNDSRTDIDFDCIREKLSHTFGALFPTPSTFETEP